MIFTYFDGMKHGLVAIDIRIGQIVPRRFLRRGLSMCNEHLRKVYFVPGQGNRQDVRFLKKELLLAASVGADVKTFIPHLAHHDPRFSDDTAFRVDILTMEDNMRNARIKHLASLQSPDGSYNFQMNQFGRFSYAGSMPWRVKQDNPSRIAWIKTQKACVNIAWPTLVKYYS